MSPALRILDVFLSNPNKAFFGSDIVEITKLPGGTVYPMLARLRQRGYLGREFEKLSEEEKKKRKPRRAYFLKAGGPRRKAQELVDAEKQKSDQGKDAPEAIPEPVPA